MSKGLDNMGSLTSALDIALGALDVDQGALNTTSNNIANVNTPGYTRQVVSLEEAPPTLEGNLLMGTGVELGQVTSERNNILELRMDQETQQQGMYSSILSALQQVQSIFNETSGAGLQSSISGFFSSLQQLSTDPTNTDYREAVLTAAQDMAQAFNQSATNVQAVQQSEDLSVQQSVNEINTLTAQIAQVNGQVSAAEGLGQNAGSLIDQRDQLIQQVSSLVDVSEINAGNGSINLTTTSGAALVVGNQSFELTTQPDATTGFQDVYSQGQNITEQISGGALGGAIYVRDQAIPSYLSSLDALASNLETSVNNIQEQGTDLNGDKGTAFFTAPPSGGQGAAAAMSVAITDPSQIAASLNGSTGDNSNVNAMIALENDPIVNGQTPINAYSNLVFQIGNDTSTAQSENDSAQGVIEQLQNQIGAYSGVSLDEEAANLTEYQRAYQAAAQVAGVINDLLLTAINIGNSTTQS